MNLWFWIWNSLQYFLFQSAAIWVLCKLKGILARQNAMLIMIYCAIMLVREAIFTFYFWIKTNQGQSWVELHKDGNVLGEFLRVYNLREFNDWMDFIFIIFFYFIICKSLTFWDYIFHEKISNLYENMHLFEETE